MTYHDNTEALLEAAHEAHVRAAESASALIPSQQNREDIDWEAIRQGIRDELLNSAYERALRDERARRAAKDVVDRERGEQAANADVDFTAHAVNGADFMFSDFGTVAPVWGTAEQTAWAEGEAMMIAAPQGTGKTTLAGQLVQGRLGLLDELLGLPIVPGRGRVLYLAMDRPRQAARSMARMFHRCTPEQKQVLAERLVFWKGPLPASLLERPQIIAEMAKAHGADTVIIDSIKDVIPKLTDDASGLAYNMAVQYCVRDGIEVCGLHHTRKAAADNLGTMKSVDDIYGSTWITAGHGSIFAINGKTGDLVVKFQQLKMVNDEIGPFEIVHDHENGRTSINGGFDMLVELRKSGSSGLTVKEAAMAMFATTSPTSNATQKARRALDRLAKPGVALARLEEGTSGGKGGGIPAKYYATGTFEVPASENVSVYGGTQESGGGFGGSQFEGGF